MAWTQAQLAKARKMYKARGNRKTWAECIASVTKGAKKKAPAKRAKVSGTGTKKKAAPKRVTVVRASGRKVNVKVAGIGSIALSKVKEAQQDIARLEKLKDGKKGAERKQIMGAISGLKKFKNSFKKFL